MKQRVSKSKQSEHNKSGYGFLSLWLFGFIVFTVYPLFYSLYLSFNDVRLTVRGWETVWVGFENYTNTFLTNTTFVPALIEFIIMELVYVPTIIIISFILASLLNREMKFRGLFRVIYFLPVIVLSGPVMYQLVSSDSTKIGDISEILIFKAIRSFSLEFSNVIELLFENLTLILWFTGIPIILFINGLRKIPSTLYEAAQIDGATSWQILWKIKIPLIKPIALVVGFFSTIQLGLYEINPTYDLIKGALANTANGMGIAATFSWIYTFVILMLIGVLYLVLREPKEVYKKNLEELQEEKRQQRLRYEKIDKIKSYFSIEENINRLSQVFKRGER